MSITNDIVDYSERDFSEYWRGKSKRVLHEVECRLVREMLPSKRGWFLDLGCGYGRLLPTYLDEKRKIVMVDYALNHLEIAAKEYNNQDIHLIAADACHLPFQSDVFESGVCIRLMHHISSAENFMKEIARVFRPGSTLILNYMNKRSLLRVLRYGSRSFQRNHEKISDIIYGTHPSYFIELAEESGFTIKRIRGAGFIHQIVHEFEYASDLIDRAPLLMKIIRIIEQAAGSTLGRMDLALMQYALLKKIRTVEKASEQSGMASNLIDLLACPECRSDGLEDNEKNIVCTDCGKKYEKIGRIIDFRCK